MGEEGPLLHVGQCGLTVELVSGARWNKLQNVNSVTYQLCESGPIISLFYSLVSSCRKEVWEKQARARRQQVKPTLA